MHPHSPSNEVLKDFRRGNTRQKTAVVTFCIVYHGCLAEYMKKCTLVHWFNVTTKV